MRPDLANMVLTKQELSAQYRREFEREHARSLERAKEKFNVKIEAAARSLMAKEPGLPFGMALIRAREDPEQDQRLQDAKDKLEHEKERHRQSGAGKTADEIEKHTKMLALAHKLMSRDTSLTIDMAMRRVYREHPELAPASTKPADTVPARHGDSLPIGGSYLVTAQLATQLDGLPSEVMYFPAGRSTITPTVNGKPKEISVTVTPSTAAALQADLSRLLSGNVRPYVDFDHAGGAAAALPRRFFWKDGEGVMMELDWTGAGKTAIGDRNYSYLSPTFMLSSDGDAINLPSTGAIASLVNNPAFRTIRRIHV
jgi:hypothetical protein